MTPTPTWEHCVLLASNGEVVAKLELPKNRFELRAIHFMGRYYISSHIEGQYFEAKLIEASYAKQ